MTDHAIIKGTFAKYLPVSSRNVLQLFIEVPLEQQEQVFKALGYPMPKTDLWVAVARLNEKATVQVPSEPEQPVAPATAQQEPVIAVEDCTFSNTGKPVITTLDKPKLSKLPRSRQMQKLCGIATFQDWVTKEYGHIRTWSTASAPYTVTNLLVKAHCGIEHSAELDETIEPENDLYDGSGRPVCATKWDTLLHSYRMATGQETWTP